MPNDYIVLYTSGGKPVNLDAVPTSINGVYTVAGIIASGLSSTTAGVTDSTDKRFVTDDQLATLDELTNGTLTTAALPDSTDRRYVTDAELAALVGGEQILATVPAVDLNTATPTTLYAVPALKTCVITKIILSAPSISLTTASISLGFNSAAFNDLIANATHTGLTGATKQTVLTPFDGASMGVAAAVLKLLANTLQGAPATVNVRVFGLLY